MIKHEKKQTGFTLIELLVVVAILGILAAVVVPSVIVFLDEGEKETADAEIRSVKLGVTSIMALADSETLAGTGIDNWIGDFTPSGIIFAQSISGTMHQLGTYLHTSDPGYWYRISADGEIEGSYDGTDAGIFN